MKEKIHALSEEMVANLGRLVAIDSQLGTPEEGKPFGEGPASNCGRDGIPYSEFGQLLWLCRDGRRRRNCWYRRTS